MILSDEFIKQQLDRTKWTYDTRNWSVDVEKEGGRHVRFLLR